MYSGEVIASAPGKLMLFGEHAVVYGYPCLVTAVDQRMKVYTSLSAGNSISIQAPEVKIEDYRTGIRDLVSLNHPKEVRFLIAALHNFYSQHQITDGLRLRTSSEFSSKFGFGSSSAVTVAVLRTVSELFKIPMTNEELFNMSYKSVLDVQGVGSGFDLAAAIYGGTLYFVTGGKEIQEINHHPLPLQVGYSGIKADTATLVRKVQKLREERPVIVNGIFNLMAMVVEEARVLLKTGEVNELGKLMDLNQGLLDTLGVSTYLLSNLIYSVRNSGALGAKLSGAGGGDCILALTPPDPQKVRQAIRSKGGSNMDVKLGAEGVRLE